MPLTSSKHLFGVLTSGPSPPPFPASIPLTNPPRKAPSTVLDGEKHHYGGFKAEPECWVYGVEEGDGFEDCEEGTGVPRGMSSKPCQLWMRGSGNESAHIKCRMGRMPYLSTMTTFVTKCNTNALLEDVGRSNNKYNACRTEARLLVPNPGTARVLPVRVCLTLLPLPLGEEGGGGYRGGSSPPSFST
jgi:hypothetical protein